MAWFAEIDLNNIVLRVAVADDNEVTANGGNCSEQAAEHFKNIISLSENGVKWVQTDQSNPALFRKNYAGVGFIYDPQRDAFYSKQPYPSWILNENTCKWEPPVGFPGTITFGDAIPYSNIIWKEDLQKWLGYDFLNNEYQWITSSNSWVATGNVVLIKDR